MNVHIPSRQLQKLLFAILLWALSPAANIFADSYMLQLSGRDSVIGATKFVTASKEDTLSEIARRYDLGYDEIVKANAGVDRWLPGEGTKILLPSKFVLPDSPYVGIIINLAELRLYYFPSAGPHQQQVLTFPISIGRMGWKSPLGTTKVIRKERNPAWYPPATIQREHLAEGDPLPKMIPGGVPENPLGLYALYLGIQGYLIHGTDEKKEYGIGMRVTHGCIRMYPEDIEKLYSLVDINTPVRFVDQPVKFGWQGAELFAEIHTPLKEDEVDFEEYSHRVEMDEVNALLAKYWSSALAAPIDLDLLRSTVITGNGVPVSIARTSNSLPPSRR